MSLLWKPSTCRRGRCADYLGNSTKTPCSMFRLGKTGRCKKRCTLNHRSKPLGGGTARSMRAQVAKVRGGAARQQAALARVVVVCPSAGPQKLLHLMKAYVLGVGRGTGSFNASARRPLPVLLLFKRWLADCLRLHETVVAALPRLAPVWVVSQRCARVRHAPRSILSVH